MEQSDVRRRVGSVHILRSYDLDALVPGLSRPCQVATCHARGLLFLVTLWCAGRQERIDEVVKQFAIPSTGYGKGGQDTSWEKIAYEFGIVANDEPAVCEVEHHLAERHDLDADAISAVCVRIGLNILSQDQQAAAARITADGQPVN